MNGKNTVISILFILTSLVLLCNSNQHGAETDDNDFAEFEDFDDEDDEFEKVPIDSRDTGGASGKQGHYAPEDDQNEDDDDGIVEDEDDEFDHFDEDEFEGFDGESKPTPGKPQEKPDLKITNIPLHLRTNWDSFYVEILMLVGLAVYFLNFLHGKTKNSRLAAAWLNSHRELLESNFSLVGDDGVSTETQPCEMLKESENLYLLWCSGRTCCEGMLVELKLLKRQDLISVISRLLRPTSDQISIKVSMNSEDMDTFVFAVGQKKTISKIHKDLADLSSFCTEKKMADKGLASLTKLSLLSEIGDATTAMLDGKLLYVLKNMTDLVDYIHFSDQYSGPKQQDDQQQNEVPKRSKVLIFVFNVPGQGYATPEGIESMKPLMQLVFHCVERVKRYRLPKEAKTKADKNRQKIEESYLKQQHTQRQELSQQRREDKRRAEKEKILAEDDPDKQRKMEEREHRREMKKKQPKVKQMKVRQ